jgi:hypothetical protein
MKAYVPIKPYPTELLRCEVSDDVIENINKEYALVEVGHAYCDLRILHSGEKFSLLKFKLAKTFYLREHEQVILPDGTQRTASKYKIWMHSSDRREIRMGTALHESCQKLYDAECKFKMITNQFKLARDALDIADNDDCERESKQEQFFKDKWLKAEAKYEERRSAKYFAGF